MSMDILLNATAERNGTVSSDVTINTTHNDDIRLRAGALAALLSTEVLLTLVCLFANSLVIAAFCLNKRLRRSVTNFYLLQLSLVNTLTGLASVPHMAALLTSPADSVTCVLSHVTVLTVCGLSSMSLLVICYDRFLAIAGPLYYRARICRRRVLIHCVATYCLPLAIFLVLPLIWRKRSSAGALPVVGGVCSMCSVLAPNYLAFVAAPFFSCVTCLLVLFVAVTRHLHARRMRSVEKLIASMPFNWKRNSAQRRSARLTKTSNLVLACFLTCWTPFLLNLGVQVSAYCHSFEEHTEWMKFQPVLIEFLLLFAGVWLN